MSIAFAVFVVSAFDDVDAAGAGSTGAVEACTEIPSVPEAEVADGALTEAAETRDKAVVVDEAPPATMGARDAGGINDGGEAAGSDTQATAVDGKENSEARTASETEQNAARSVPDASAVANLEAHSCHFFASFSRVHACRWFVES